MTANDSLEDRLEAIVRKVIVEELERRGVGKSANEPLLYTVEDAALKLGLSPTWVAEAARQKVIPSIKSGHRRMFRVEDLRAFSAKGNNGRALRTRSRPKRKPRLRLVGRLS
jgi:excisionase family DNA binding protein